MVFSKVPVVILLAAVLAQAQDPACVNDCIKSSDSNFDCVGFDFPCYCSFDNGKFFPKFKDCIQAKCPTSIDMFAAANCPEPSPSSVSVRPTTGSDTVTFTNKEEVTSTVVKSSVESGTATLIDDTTTDVFTTSGIVITTAVVEGSITRLLTLTTQTVGNVTTTSSDTAADSGSGTVVVVPSTIQSTFTTEGSTITSAVTTESITRTTGGDGPGGSSEATVTSTAGAMALGQEIGGVGMVLAMGMGIIGGWFGLV